MSPSTDVVLRRLERLHPKAIDLSLDRVRRLLNKLDNPQENLPPVVHVAGTNGKGSTIAFLRSILDAHGYRVHAFTSPHLVRFNERISVSGGEIDDDHLLTVLEDCEQANAGAPITFFEITTAAAFLAFARSEADVLLLETGLGGRLDATNVVSQPAVSVLTPIALDHQGFLGSTLPAIAAEKVGILKCGVPCVSACQAHPALSVIESRAASLDAPLILGGRDWRAEGTGEGFAFESARGRRRLPAPSLLGEFQFQNASLAVAVSETFLGARIDAKQLSSGIRSAQWRGRLQRLAPGRLTAMLPEDWELWVDGGHNPAAAVVVAKHAKSWKDRPLVLVLGMMQVKDAAGFMGPFAEVADAMLAVPVPATDNGLAPAELCRIAQKLALRTEAHPDVPSALRAASRISHAAARVLISGSLYLIGSVLAANEADPTFGK